MSITLSPVSPIYSPINSPMRSIFSPVSTIYSASTNSFPNISTSLPIIPNQDVVITSDYPLIFNKNKHNLAISPLYPYAYPNIYPYTNPSVVIPYENLNKNTDVVNRLTKYFYYKVLDDYLYDNLNGLLRYLKISNDKVDIIKSEDDRDKENINQHDTDMKVEFIEKHIFSKDDMYDILMKITNETDIEIIKLSKNEYIVEGYVKKWFKREFQKMMNK